MTPLWHPNLAKLTLWPQEPPVTCWPWQLQREGVPAWQAPEPWALVGHWKPPGWRQHHDQFTCILTGGPPEVEHGMWELQSAVRGYDCAHRGVSLTWGTAGSAMKSTVLQPCCCSEGQESQSALYSPLHHTEPAYLFPAQCYRYLLWNQELLLCTRHSPQPFWVVWSWGTHSLGVLGLNF